MNWYEELPPDCPPEEAFAPGAIYFRLGKIPPDESDFWSHRKRFPDKFFQTTECVARSVSVFDSMEAVEKLKRSFPMMAKKLIYQIDLMPKDGLVLQTGEEEHHFSWWRSTQFEMASIKKIDP